MNVAAYYKDQNTEHVHSVRPWMDEDYACKSMMGIITQFALFKCMHNNCIFSTNCDESWTEHMVEHLKLIETLDKKGLLNKNCRNEQIKFRECPYCNSALKSNYQVTAHIEFEHQTSIFQCAFCYYRSIEMDSIILHYDCEHPGKKQEVLLCGENREFEHDDGELILFEGQQYIKNFDCGKIFDILSNFADKQKIHIQFSFFIFQLIVMKNSYISIYSLNI